MVNMGELLVGGKAIEMMLKDVDINGQLKHLIKEVRTVRSASKRDAMVKKIKYLAGIQKNKIDPATAYVVHNMPVIPPIMRPATSRGANRIEFADVNMLYKDHMLVNNSLKELIDVLPPDQLINERKALYDGAKAAFGLGDPIGGQSRGRGLKGLVKQIAGTSGPKGGLFQSRILSKKQDFSGRATIYAEPNIGFNEAAIPKDMLWTLYKYHILRDLSRSGYNWVEGNKAWTLKDTAATNSFNKVIKQVPVILNRAPTLMKTNITAHFPVPIEGSTIGLNPLHLPLYAGDYDGDALTVHLPMTPEAVEEAKQKLLPQHQIFDYRKGVGNSMIMPGHEAIVGSTYMSEPDMTQKVRHFKTEAEVLEALKKGDIKENTPVRIG
jgi:DNA-directed RNA polymerase subunit beta'